MTTGDIAKQKTGGRAASGNSFLHGWNAEWDAETVRRFLWGLLLLGLLVRGAYVFTVRNQPLGWGDEFSYDALATHLVQDKMFAAEPGQPTLYRAPLYPFLMAGVYAVLGLHNFLVLRILNVLAAALTVPVLVLVAKQLSGCWRVGVVAGVFFVLNPVLIFTTGLLYTETVYLLLFLVIVSLWLRIGETTEHRDLWSAVAGVLFGLSHLMRPNLMLFPAPLFLWYGLSLRDWRLALRIVVTMTATTVLIMAPWVWRNYQLSGRVIPVSANSGINLHQGNNDLADGGALDIKYVVKFADMTEWERDAAYMRLGWEWIAANPGRFIALIPAKLYKFFSPLETSNRGKLITLVAPFVYLWYIIHYGLAITGIVWTAKAWRHWLLPHLLIAYFVLLTVVLYGGTRYSSPIQPFLMIFAAYALVEMVQRWSRRWATPVEHLYPVAS